MALKTEYEINDSELVWHIRENANDDAKDSLYEKYTPLIYKEIYRVKKRAVALGVELADLSQEAMLAFSYAINSFDEDADVKFVTYTTVVIRRKLANYLNKFETKKNKTMVEAVSMDAPVDDENQSAFVETMEESVSTDPLRKMITNETLIEVNKAIKEKLSKNEKIVLQFDLDGKTIPEIVEMTGMSSKQIYNLIHRARSKLKI